MVADGGVGEREGGRGGCYIYSLLGQETEHNRHGLGK